MTTLSFPTVMPPRSTSTIAVYNRVSWADAWTWYQAIHPLSVTWSTGESIGQASFHYRFGSTVPADDDAWETREVLTINPRSFVRVVIDGTDGRADLEWVGVWRSATLLEDRQRFEAVGIEWLLNEPCRSLPFLDQTDGTTVAWSGRGLDFRWNNRSPSKETVNGQSCYVFANSGTTANWSTRDAVEMLLAAAAPKDSAGDVVFNWEPEGLDALPDYDQVEMPTHGRSYLDLLRALVTRYRLVGWRVYPETTYDEGEEEWTTAIKWEAFTFAETAISLTDAAGDEVGTIPANANQDAIVTPYDQSSREELVTEASHVADQVVVTGSRTQIVCTISTADESLVEVWTPEDETDYRIGARSAPDYPPATEVRERAERDADYRSRDELRHVWSHFRVPYDWDQMIWDGQAGAGTGTEYRAFLCEVDWDAPAEEAAPHLIYSQELHIQPSLPLLTGYAYHGTSISDRVANEGHRAAELADVPHERLPILGYGQYFDVDGTERWAQLDQIAKAADLEQTDGGYSREWAADLRPLDDGVSTGLELRVSGKPQHVITLDYVATEDYVAGSWDYTTFLYTVCFLDDRDVEVRFPSDEDLENDEDYEPLGEVVNRLRIESPQFKLVIVRPYTAVGLDPETQLVRYSDGGILEDDRPEMLIIAQRAYWWHRVPRYALRFSTGWLDGAVQVGHLVTHIVDAAGSWPVNSVITEVTCEFPVSESDRAQQPRLTIATAFGELSSLEV